MLEGRSGAKATDWEAFHRSMVHASPFLFDLDSDGIQDILLATYDGAILSFRDDVSARGRCRLPGMPPERVLMGAKGSRALRHVLDMHSVVASSSGL